MSSTTIWLIIWYIACGLLIAAGGLAFKLLTRPCFRSEIGDITTEVGYEEYPTGELLGQDPDRETDDELNDPHTVFAGSSQCGLL